MNNKEKFIQDTLGSIKNIEKAKANPFLFQKIVNRMENENQTIRPTKLRWAIAALALLIGLNVLSILFNKKNSQSQSGMKAFQTEYFSYINHYSF